MQISKKRIAIAPNRHFLWNEKTNRRPMIFAGLITILQFSIFKLLYPFPDFFSDSYSYIYAASADLAINIWPIGYSRFLWAFHQLTHSDTAVVAFQYFLLELTCLYFYLTLLYFHNPGKFVRNIIYILLFINPLFLYICNYINSDAIFASLSVIWFTQLLWIIHRPSLYQLFAHAVVLFLCFTVRNNAYYYPFISLFAFILSSYRLWAKAIGIILPVLLIGIFVLNTRKAAKNITGKAQFSLFTGWQLANNALYIYPHLTVDTTTMTSPDLRELNRLSLLFYKQMPPEYIEYLIKNDANTFIRQPRSPLKSFFYDHYYSRNESESISNWGKASIIYSSFGKTLIEEHPIAYLQYFAIPNTKNYFLPLLEKLQIYNLGEDKVNVMAQDWFDYQTSDISSVSKDAQGMILAIFPHLFLFVNVLFVGSIVWLLFSKGRHKISKQFLHVVLITITFVGANFIFCLTATIIVLRYEFFPMIVLSSIPLILIDWLDKIEVVLKKKTSPVPNQHPNLEALSS